jgi:hypothetical protein
VTPVLFGIIVLAFLAALVVAVRRHSRAQLLARIREDWGKPIERERKMDAILTSHRSRLANTGAAAALDDRTWGDLDLDDVFAVVDRTESTLGQHALYHRLRTAPLGDHLDAFEALVSRMESDAGARERAQVALARLQDPHGYDLWWLTRSDAIEVHPWYALFPALAAATLALIVLAPFWPQAVVAAFAAIGVSVFVRMATDARIGALARAFRQIAPVISAGRSLRFISGTDVDPLVGSLQRDAPTLGRLKTIARWISGDPFMLPARAGMLAVLLNDVVAVVYEYLNLALLLDANGVYFGARALRARAPALLRVAAAAGEVDAAISIASLRAEQTEWTRPHFHAPGCDVSWTDVRHPLLADPVPNSIVLMAGHGALITGSNMSGKSTFLRTIGVATVMAQTVHTCLAQEYVAPVLIVRSCIGRSDDLSSGKSYYMAEVETLLALVAASNSPNPHLFLLDELFRGTNAVERIAAGDAVLRELLSDAERARPHVVLAATHDGELVDLLPDIYDARHFGDSVGPDGLIFNHRLGPGPATTRNAIALLRLQGAPHRLIARATELAAELDRQRGIAVTGRT